MKKFPEMVNARHWQNGSCCLGWISPDRIKYCTPSSPYTDINQHDANLDHPHAFYDRGYFYESIRAGQVIAGKWDKADLLFTDLLEYKAVEDHMKGIRRWRNSDFALRIARFISKGNKSRGFSDPEQYMTQRGKDLDQLIKSIALNGVVPNVERPMPGKEIDDISVNIGRYGGILFNNRGHHRVAIAKVLGIIIPVAVIAWHKEYVDQYGFVFPGCECCDCQIKSCQQDT